MNASGVLRQIWRWVRWPFWIVVALFVAFIALGIYLSYEKDITGKAVTQINARKLTLADVEGKNLPPVPDQAENDATVVGIDKNNNGIRDDVELAIFKKYPNDIKVRAAELQYAMALQTDITLAFNSGSWAAAAYQDSRAYFCIGETYPRTNLKEYSRITDARNKEVEDLVFNTIDRQNKRGEFADLEKNNPFNPPESDFCDVNL